MLIKDLESPIYVSNDRPLSTITFITDRREYEEYAHKNGYNFLYIDIKKINEKKTIAMLSRYLSIFDEYCDRYIISLSDSTELMTIIRLVSLPVSVLNNVPSFLSY